MSTSYIADTLQSLCKNVDDKGAFKKTETAAIKLISPVFRSTYTSIKSKKFTELILPGGRGSTKSSFASIVTILLMLKNPKCHAVAFRRYDNRLRRSVYAQICWAISEMGLSKKFKCTVSPMECTYLPTGQKIMFFGLDDPDGLKSIKTTFGYIGIAWFEELDQFAGPKEVRNVEQSVLRGGPFSFTIKSFNPPAASRNWANKYVLENKAGKKVVKSTYLTTPKHWLGERFILDAEHLKETNPTAYRHEYLGEVVGNGTQVFDNLRLEPITKAMRSNFDNVISGVDWGWYPDAWAFNRTYYDAARRTLYIFDEITRHKCNNQETAKLVLSKIDEGELVIADSAERKSCADYRDMGINCIPAKKPPGSVNQSMKWLQGLAAIVIDTQCCPDTVKEFSEYEYETTRDGEVMQGYPDTANHHIDCTRYATNAVWLRKGT